MKPVTKISIATLAGVVSCTVLYYTALFALPYFVNPNNFKSEIISELEKETGFKISCENVKFNQGINPKLKLNLHHTLVAYPNGETFLKLKETDISVKLLPLLLKKIEPYEITLTRPIINLTLYKDFSTSLDKYLILNKPVNTNGFQLVLANTKLLGENYKIKINDESINKLFNLEGEKFVIKDFVQNKRAHIITSGKLSHKNKQYIKYDIDVDSCLNEKQQFTFSPFKTIYYSDIQANIYAKLKEADNSNINGEIKVSGLSLKADDLHSANNNINLLFKGEKIGIESEIHTSKNDVAKLKGEYTYGKKPFIDINTKAKNIKIENLHKILYTATNILNIQNPLKDVELKGSLNADFNIKSDFKTLNSSGLARISNAEIKHKLLPYSINNINSDISFENNEITIKKAEAVVNNTPMTITGRVNKKVEYEINAKSNNLEIANVVKLFNLDKNIPVNIEKGNFSFDVNIKGVSTKTHFLNGKLNAKSLVLADKTSKIPIRISSLSSEINGNEKKYNGSILLENLISTVGKQQIKANKFNLLFDEHVIKIPENIIFMPAPLVVKGEIRNYNTKAAGKIDFRGNISANVISNIVKDYSNLANKAVGNIKTIGEINFNNDNIHLKSQLNADRNNYVSFAVIKELLNRNSVVNVDCIFNKNNLTIKDLSLYENTYGNNGNRLPVEKMKKIAGVNGEIENAANAQNAILKNVKISVPDYISAASAFLGGEEFTLKTDILLNNKISAPEIRGNAQISRLNIKKYLTAIKNADLDFSNKAIKINAPDVTINNSMFNINAKILPDLNRKKFSITDLIIHCGNLDLNSLFPILKQDIASNLQINIAKSSITINNVQLLDLKANDVSADISAKNNVVTVGNIIGKAYGGSFSGTMQYGLHTRELKSLIRGNNVDIKTSLFDLCKLDDNLSGRANFNADFSLFAGEYKQTIKSLNGKLNFNAKNGKMGTLGKFEYYLYAQNILYHGLMNTTLNRIAEAIRHDNTTQYREANGNISFANGYMTTETLTTTGTNMSLYVTGRHNLISNQANINIYGRISDSINSRLGSYANYSIADLFTGQSVKKEIPIVKMPNEIVSKIPDLYNNTSGKSNTFKVNVCGNIKNASSINSFTWISSKDNMPYSSSTDLKSNQNTTEEQLPDFNDLMNQQ